jgi:zinc protease
MMRIRWTTGIVLVAMAAAVGQVGAQAAPSNTVDTSTTDFMVDHVHVILRRSSANDVIAANVYLLGGTRQLTPATAGVEALMLAASEEGTRQFPKATLRAVTAATGATINIGTSVDWTTFGLLTLRQTFDSSWAVFADRLVAPRLDSSEVERIRGQMLTGARESDLDPDAAVRSAAESLLYADHPYRLDPGGTAASLSGLTVGDVRAYHATQVVQTRMLVVVVGNIDRSTLERAVKGRLATLPVGTYRW